MMIYTFSEYIKEEFTWSWKTPFKKAEPKMEEVDKCKITGLKPGDEVEFKADLYDYKEGRKSAPVLHKTKDQTGVVKSVKKKISQYGGEQYFIEFELDVLDDDMNKKTITVNTSSQGIKKYFQLVTPEYLELKRQLVAGEIAKYKASKEFKHVIKEIKFKKKSDYFDWTNFDLVKDEFGYVTYIPSKKSIEKDSKKFIQKTKVGRVLKKLNPDLKDKDIEEFGNKFRAEAESVLAEPKIEVMTGKDISYWYDGDRYKKGGGTLNSSCMKHEDVSFYTKFPEQIALATIIKDDKLYARALVWRLDDGRVYMDRVYSVNAMDGIQLEKYAKKHNMVSFKNLAKAGDMKITLKGGAKYAYNSKFDLPYFDTFMDEEGKKGDLILTSYDD
jgi:hypothetical protein